MSGIDEPGTPPEVPEEYADVYRDAYERALAEGEGDLADELLTSTVIAREPTERPTWAVPATVGAGAVVLVLCAFVLGKMLSSDDVADAGAPVATASTAPTSSTPSPSPSKKPTAKASEKPSAKAWAGPVVPIAVDGVTATCTAPPGNDSAGDEVRYDADNAIDGDLATAWRCNGTGIGTVLTLTVPDDTEVGQVGLVPGYAKTDPKSGADRYAENNRITRVRWTLADGTVVVQRLDPSPDNREMQLVRVPRTATGTLTLEVLAVDRGTRNITAISELAVYRAG